MDLQPESRSYEEPRISKVLINTVHFFSTVGVWIAGIVLVLIAVLIFVEVFSRYLLHNSITGVQEISELAIVAVLYLGLSYSTYQRSHVQVDVLINAFRPDIKMIDQGIMSFLCILLSGPMSYQMFQQGLTYVETGMSSSLLHIPHWPFYIIAAWGLFWTTMEFLLDGIRWFQEAKVWRKENLKNKKEGNDE